MGRKQQRKSSSSSKGQSRGRRAAARTQRALLKTERPSRKALRALAHAERRLTTALSDLSDAQKRVERRERKVLRLRARLVPAFASPADLPAGSATTVLVTHSAEEPDLAAVDASERVLTTDAVETSAASASNEGTEAA